MSELKVNKITPKTGTSIQLGESGDTITIPCGATLTNNGTSTGFGLSFCTTVKTSPFTATANKGFLINTGSAVTVTLPASPTTGSEIIVVDQTGQAATNNITLGRNGSKIKGQCCDATLSTNRGGLRLVYSGSSQGWITATAGNDETATQFAVASGGTETTSGDYKIHTFTSDANFVVSQIGNADGGSDKVSYMVVAGGGGANTGGGGSGGFREGKNTPKESYTASPLAAACSGLTVAVATYPITVGGGGSAPSGNGSNSVFSTITSAGGGGAGGPNPVNASSSGAAGGSGGGGTQGAALPAPQRPASGGAGNTPPVSPPQGNPGGGAASFDQTGAGGGGGAGAAGANATTPPSPNSSGIGGAGGAGVGTAIHPNAPSPVGTPGPDGTLRYFAGGGAGSHYSPNAPSTPSDGGVGGGGSGGIWNGSSNTAGGTGGTVNTGGGAGGKTGPCAQGGGSGIVIIRYKYQ